MVHLEKLNQISYTPDGDTLAWYDLSVSTAAELPALNSVVFGAKIQAPSRAQIIQTGDFVTLDENGSWYSADGSGAVSSGVNASVGSTRGMTKAAPTRAETLSNSLLDIEPETAEYVEPKEPVEVKDGGDHR